MIKAYAPRVNEDYCLAICGNQKILGDWNPDKALLMSDINFPEWQTELDAGKLSFPIEYKFILYNKKEKHAEAWENNPNRYMAKPELKANETLVISDRYAYFDIPAWKGAGVAVPIFSLKSEKSFGVGDFDRLGGQHRPESSTDTTDQRYYHDAYMDRFLSIQQYLHLCISSDVRRSQKNGYVKEQRSSLGFQQKTKRAEYTSYHRL